MKIRWGCVALSVSLSVSVAAQSTKLNDPLLRGPGGWVGSARISPDGTRVLYSATQDSQVSGLFSAPIGGGGSAIELVSRDVFNPLLASVAWHNPWTFAFTPDARIVYSDSQDLFAVPIDGSRAPVRLLRPVLDRRIETPALTWVGPFVIAPDGEHVVFTANAVNAQAELFSARMGEDAEAVMLQGLSEVTGIQFTPDGQTVVFQTYNDFHSVPIEGGASPVQLNGEEFSYGHLPWWITPDGERVVYVAVHVGWTGYRIFSAPLDGSSPAVQLNGPLVNGGSVDYYQLRPSPRGDRVVYVADQERDDREELYSVPADGSSPAVKLNGLVSRAGDVIWFQISPDGSRVIFPAGNGPSPRRLQSVPIDRSREPIALDGPLPRDSFVQFAAGGSRIVYQDDEGAIDLYSASIVRQDSRQLTHGEFPYMSSSFRVTPDGRTVVFIGNASEILRMPVDGSGAPALVGALDGVLPGALQLGADGRVVLFEGYILATRRRELFSVPLDGLREPRRLNGPLATEMTMGNVTWFQVEPAEHQAVFTVPLWNGHEDLAELYRVGLDSDPEPLELFPLDPAPGTYGIYNQQLSSQAGRLLFRKGDSDSGWDLLSAALDGGGVVQLNDPTTSAGGVVSFRLTGDGEWGVFTSSDGEEFELYSAPVEGGPELDLTEEPSAYQVAPVGRLVVFVSDSTLFSMPADGSASPIQLAGPFPPGSLLHSSDLQVTADRAVYRGNVENLDVYELFSAPLDGSLPAVKLDLALGSGHDVQPGFQLSPDGSWVVYRADRSQDEVFQLFAVPADGSAEPVRLSGELVAGGDVAPDFQIDPLGARVIYRADSVADERFELFAVPLDGSSEPLRLNGTLVTGGDVLGSRSPSRPSFRISSDGTRLVYRADQDEDEVAELYGVPLDGSAGAIRLGGPLDLGRAVLEGFQLTPDGKLVVYVADQDADNVFELYSAPTDRSKDAHKLNGPLVRGGDVVLRWYLGGESISLPFFQLTPDGRSVLYLADQDTDEAFELYRSSLARPAAREAGPAPLVGR